MKTAAYHYGEFSGIEDISKRLFKDMEELSEQALLGFYTRKQDEGKTFYANPDYVDEGADGIAVKWAYAIEPEEANR